MIQRIQTVYMIIAVILAMACLFLPVGTFVPTDMKEPMVMYNICILSGTVAHEFIFTNCAMFIVLVAEMMLAIAAIFMYKNRRRQAKMCTFAALLLVVWYILYIVFGFMKADDFNAEFSVKTVAALPAVSLILTLLARRAILKDEALVRAADRIR